MSKTNKKKKNKRPEHVPSSFYLSRPTVIAISIFIAAFLVRLFYLFQIRSTLSFTHPIMDSLYYIKWAQDIAAGTYQPDRAFFMGPLYPYFLAVIVKLLGMGWMKVRLVQIIIGSLSVVLVYGVTRRCFNRENIAVIAAILSLFWGILIYYDANLLMASLVVFLNLLLLWMLLGLLNNPSPVRFFLSGIVLGLSALARASIFLFIPFCLIWFFGAFRSRLPGRTLGRMAGLFLLGIALLVLPVTARNYLVEKDWVLITSNGGLNFYIGNNPYSKGVYIPLNLLKLPYGPTPPSTSYDRMDLEAKKIAEKIEGHKLKSSEISSFWFGRAMEFLKREPGAFMLNLATKAALCWNAEEIPQIEDFQFFARRFSVLGIPLLNFGIFAPLALWGIVLGLKSPEQEIRLLIYYLLAMTVVVSLFFVTSRYRAPLVPPVLILAVYAFYDLVNRLREKEWLRASKGILGVGVLAFLVNQPMVHNDFAENHYNRGTIYYRTGKWDKALEEFSTCLSIRPDYADAYRAMGIIYRRRKLYPQALFEFNKAQALRPDYKDIQVHIAIVYIEQNRLDEARYELEQLLKETEEFPLALLTMGKLLLVEGQTEKAETVLLRTIKLSPEISDPYVLMGEINALQSRFDIAAGYFQTALSMDEQNADEELYYKLGVTYHRIGRYETAEAALLKALAKNPALIETHIALGNLYFDLNRYDEAVKHFESAYRQRPDVSNQYNLANAYAEAGEEERAIKTYEKLLISQPGHKRALNNLGNVFLNKKQYDKAIAYYQMALRIDPQFSAALHNLGDIYHDRKDYLDALDYYRKSLFLEVDPRLRALLEEKLKNLEDKINQ